MGLILAIIAAAGWLAVFFAWSLCRAAAQADRMAEQQRDRREPK